MDILARYQDRLTFMLGGHVHTAEIRAPLSSFAVDLKNISLMMTPSIAPIFNNNPGYTILSFDNEDITKYEFKWRFFQLQEYYLLRFHSWQTYNPEHIYPVKLDNPESIRSYSREMLND